MKRRQIQGGIVGLIGFMLSPLSWWNDLVVNIPLAIIFGWLISLVYEPAFTAAMVVGYWLTNLTGLIMLRRGARDLLAAPKLHSIWREWMTDLLMSLLYNASHPWLSLWETDRALAQLP